MRIVQTYDDKWTHVDEPTGEQWDESDCYEILVCPACNRVTFRTYRWNELMDAESDVSYKTLYPSTARIPLGLPTGIEKAFGAALKVKAVDSNAFGVLLRRVLELV